MPELNPQTVTLRKLSDEKYSLILDSQDIAALLDHVSFPVEWREYITGAVASIDNGEYTEIWFTESSKPYDTLASYSTLAYYLG